MNPNLVVLQVVLSIAAGLVALALLMRHLSAKRRAALEAVAQQAGWTFAPDRVRPAQLGVRAMPLFSEGRRQRAHNVMRGHDGATTIAVFDYRYTVGSGKQQRTITQTVVHLRLARLALPPFTLGPENMLHKIGGVFGYHDIDFDSSPEFSKKYLLRAAANEQRVRDLFTPVVRAFFEHRLPLSVEGDGDELIVYRHRKALKPEEVRTFVEDAFAIARQLTHS